MKGPSCRSSHPLRRTPARPRRTDRPASPAGDLSNKARFWIGAALALPGLVVVGFLSAVPSILADAAGANASSDLTGIATLLIDVVLFGLFIAALVWEKTRGSWPSA